MREDDEEIELVQPSTSDESTQPRISFPLIISGTTARNQSSPQQHQRRSYGSLDTRNKGVILAWRNLSVFVPSERRANKFDRKKSHKLILDNVSGAVRPKSLLAVMGSSGAGKSTLLDALAFRTSKDLVMEGDVLVNGRRLMGKIGNISGYVHQNDLLFGSLTVKEHLTFMARMKMDKNKTMSQVKRRVNELLANLELTSAQNTQIGNPHVGIKGISGGERKRLSFASEIFSDPPLLFCDEPTSGLDSFNAGKLVAMMYQMSSGGKTIICTIHQPSSELFAMFDQLMLMSEGRVAFMGPPSKALKFFKSLGYSCPPTYNPADFFIRTLSIVPNEEQASREKLKRICNAFEFSYYCQKVCGAVNNEYNNWLTFSDEEDTAEEDHIENNALNQVTSPGFCTQFHWLAWRSFIDSYRNKDVHQIRIIAKIIVGVLLALCYSSSISGWNFDVIRVQELQGAIYIMVIENVFNSIYSVLRSFPAELPIFRREYKNQVYDCLPYYLSKVISLTPGFIIDPVLFFFIVYWALGLRNQFYAWFTTLVVLIFVTNISAACGIMFSTVFVSIHSVLVLLIPLNQILVMTGGFVLIVSTMPSWIKWLQYISWQLHGFEIISIVQWNGFINAECEKELDGDFCISNGDEVLAKYSLSASRFLWDFLVMFILYLIFHLIAFFALLIRVKRK